MDIFHRIHRIFVSSAQNWRRTCVTDVLWIDIFIRWHDSGVARLKWLFKFSPGMGRPSTNRYHRCWPPSHVRSHGITSHDAAQYLAESSSLTWMLNLDSLIFNVFTCPYDNRISVGQSCHVSETYRCVKNDSFKWEMTTYKNPNFLSPRD